MDLGDSSYICILRNSSTSAIMCSMKKFLEAFAAAAIIGACVLLRPLFRPWYSKWGIIGEESTMGLPGDELVPDPLGGYTQAISIRAPAASIWPWIAQVGQGKGGFYSYELLENLVGCNIHNTHRILPEYQDIKAGDVIVMHPKVPVIPVAIVEPGKTLVYGGKQGELTANNWIFHIYRREESTRLITRWSFQYKPALINRIAYDWFLEPIAAVMQRKMLLTIKQLAEADAAS
jgi:hypothetical protein